MYLEHWNLREKPFENVADPRFAYLSDQHQEGLARLVYLVEGRKLGGILVGPYGVGKSMVLQLLATHIANMTDTRMARLDVPPGGVDALARLVGRVIWPDRSFPDVAAVLEGIREWASSNRPPPSHTVLALDEAQLIRDSGSLDFLHLLTNFRRVGATDHPASPAFTIILAGHTELRSLVDREPALRQRLALFWELEPLNELQVMEYVEHRMRAAGGDIWAFEEDALREIATTSGGIPRTINNICDIALMIGFANRVHKITRPIILQAAEEVGALPPERKSKALVPGSPL